MIWLSKHVSAARERLRALVFRARAEADLDEELRSHLEMEADKLARQHGLAPDEARRRAALAFGGVERYKEEVRDARGLDWLTGARLDFILGLRMLVKYPALTIVGGVGMAVGIAVSVAFFAFVSAHFNPPLPLEEGDRIVALENRDIEVNDEERRSLHDFVLWRNELKSVEHLGAFRTVNRFMIEGDSPPDPVEVAEITAVGMQVARVPALMGRYLIEDDERPGAPAVVVIGYDAWRNRFASDPAIIGREVRFSRAVHTVVGVMPEGFTFPMSHQYWIPFRADPAAFARREGPEIFIFGRLAPGVTMKEAQAEITAIGLRTAAEFPGSNGKLRPMVMPYTHSLTDIQGMTTWMLVQQQMMMTLLLIVVALNVAVLVYARTATRQAEIAVRTALGASRKRIVTQLFIEALVLALGSAALGLAIAQFGVQLGNRIMEQEGGGTPFWADYSLQPRTVLFTLGIAIIAALIIGVVPAVQATGRRLQANLREMGGGTGASLGRTWTALIVAQVAIAVAALPAAVNMGWSEIRSATTRPTYPPEEYLVAEIQPDPSAEADGQARPSADSMRFGNRLGELLERLEAEPGLAGVSYSARLEGRTRIVEVEGVPAPVKSLLGHRVASIGIGPGYLDLYEARVLTGRGFEPGDAEARSTSVIVTQGFVRQILGGGPALGRRIRHIPPGGRDSIAPDEARWYEIVGVMEDLRRNAVAPDLVRPVVVYPVSLEQANAANGVSLELRVRAGAASDFAPRLRQLTAAVDPTLLLGAPYSLAEIERQSQLAVRLVALVISLVLVSVFLLSAGGVYALASFTVTRRRREIGIRSALGAHPRQVLRTIFGRVAGQIALGLGVGIVAAAMIERISGGELMGGRGRVLLPVFGALMAIVALVAAMGPARRGLKIQPTEALRSEG